MDMTKGSARTALLVVAAEKELAAELSLFDVAMFRRDSEAMEKHRERARAVLDCILDLKSQQFAHVCRENGIR